MLMFYAEVYVIKSSTIFLVYIIGGFLISLSFYIDNLPFANNNDYAEVFRLMVKYYIGIEFVDSSRFIISK